MRRLAIIAVTVALGLAACGQKNDAPDATSDGAMDPAAAAAANAAAADPNPSAPATATSPDPVSAPQSSEASDTTEATIVTSGIFEYKIRNLRIGIQINASGVALAVDNQTDEPIELDPKDIAITTSTGEYIPLTLHQIALVGLGAPGVPVSVAPHTSAGFILSGFCSRGPCAGHQITDSSPNEAEVLTDGTHVDGEIKKIQVGTRVLTRTGD